MGGGRGYGKHYNQRSISYIRDKHRLEICHKMYATQFSCERILLAKTYTSRGGICPCRHCQRQCKIFASGVNFSIFTHLKRLKLGEIDGVKFLA